MSEDEELGSLVKGKQAELRVFGELLQRGFQVYTPMVDAEGIDCLVDVGEGNYKEIQVKSREKTPLFQVRKFKPRGSFYIACCLGQEELWIVPSRVFSELGSPAKANDREYVRLVIGKEGSPTYEKLRTYYWNFGQLLKGATSEVRQTVEKASTATRIDRPHLGQTDYAIAVLDLLISADGPMTAKEIVTEVHRRLEPTMEDADKEMLEGGRQRWEANLRYTIYGFLKQGGLIQDKGKNQYVITKKGKEYLDISFPKRVKYLTDKTLLPATLEEMAKESN